MINERKKTSIQRKRRTYRVRKPLIKSMRPRLSVFRSLKHTYAQIIDDHQRVTVVGISSKSKEFSSIKNKTEVAKAMGVKLASLAKEKNIDKIVFDRGRYKFHGRVAAVAEGAREGGLTF